MNISIMGRNGFIGSEIYRRIEESNMYTIYTYPRKDIDTLFLFNSPSSDIIYKQNKHYAFSETVNGFLDAIEFCSANGIKLIYPSTANVYDKVTIYSHSKACLEEIHIAYGIDKALGFRIFAGYGVGEEHKGEYSSIVYQFCKQMIHGERPTIYGDGTQTRDFVYIDDIVKEILFHLDDCGIRDIGTGVNISFNEIVKIINKRLGKNIEPIYVGMPSNYVQHVKCTKPIPHFIDIEEGICRILKSLS